MRMFKEFVAQMEYAVLPTRSDIGNRCIFRFRRRAAQCEFSGRRAPRPAEPHPAQLCDLDVRSAPSLVPIEASREAAAAGHG
jgi:hypothetical protein